MPELYFSESALNFGCEHAGFLTFVGTPAHPFGRESLAALDAEALALWRSAAEQAFVTQGGEHHPAPEAIELIEAAQRRRSAEIVAADATV